MSITSLLMTLENSSPETVRVINVLDDLLLEELTDVVEAAFGFSGVGYPRWMDGQAEHVNGSVEKLLGRPGSTMTLRYGERPGWAVRVASLGEVAEEMPTPLLIEATGPDVLESCDGPEEMGQLRDNVRLLLAGVDERPSVMMALYRHLPHLAPQQMLQRLTTVDPVSVAERMARMVPPAFPDEGPGELSFDDWNDGERDTEPTAEIGEFLDFINIRPDLQRIIENDPDATTNPALQQAIEDFFGASESESGAALPDVEWAQGLPPLDERSAEVLAEPMLWLLDMIGEGLPLTQSGYLRPADVKATAEHLRIGEYWDEEVKREVDTTPILTLRQSMEHFELLEIRGNRIFLTETARELRDRPLDLIRHVAAFLPLLFGQYDLAPMVSHLRNWLEGTDSTPLSLLMASSYMDNLHLFWVMNALVRDGDLLSTKRLTEEGRAFVGEILRYS